MPSGFWRALRRSKVMSGLDGFRQRGANRCHSGFGRALGTSTPDLIAIIPLAPFSTFPPRVSTFYDWHGPLKSPN